MLTAAATSSGDWDPSQKAVILAAADRRLIVDAGPGTGKTAVACARLGHLVLAEDVRPSQTWMISFTRTAIAEIRARLHSYIGDAAFAVKVATVDAHAWAIHSGYDPAASLIPTRIDQNSCAHCRSPS
ncbi:UvrD-helicase domain-containing protein, partial [Sphingobium sp.]|uniref:UvrD-helicase domain-containing protein n=1 Tax=Sphingobium sp. TaxID=1912891 RepID=UPI002E246A33